MEKAIIGMMIAIVVAVMMAQVAQAMQPAPPQYSCPICGESFYTYDELYSHFTGEHPSEPIDIIWEEEVIHEH